MKTVKDVRDWLVTLANAQVEGVWSVRPLVRIGREDLLRAIEVLEPFKDLPDAPKPGGVPAADSLESALDWLGTQHPEEVMGLVRKRAAFGVSKYGVPLCSDDGRDTHKDVEDELGDLWHYTGKAIEERRFTHKQWQALATHAQELMQVYRDMAWCARADHKGPPRLSEEDDQCDDT